MPAIPSGAGGSSTTEYSSNDVWFRAATIAFPICGAIILFILIALAVRMLKNDGSLDSPSKLSGSGSSTRKIPLDYEAYGAAHNQLHHHNHHMQQHLKQSPLLMKPTVSNGADHPYATNHYTSCHNDLKNENQAKKNQLMTLEYSLLPQSCNDPNLKPTNTDLGTGQLISSTGSNNLYRNVNISLNSSTRSKDGSGSDSKIYEKEALHPSTYWNTTTTTTTTPNNRLV